MTSSPRRAPAPRRGASRASARPPTPPRILVVGGGGREHAILWKLAHSRRRPALFAAPGNAGTAEVATNLNVRADDVDGLLATVRERRIDVTVVGPEAPLVAGLVDRLREEKRAVFGPTKAAARIEWSKAFAKELMAAAGVPTAAFRVFDAAPAAKAYVEQHGAPVVVKADGLAAGKGVVVARTVREALAAVHDMMVGKTFGAAGERVLIEDCLRGQEVSVFCFVDGTNVSSLVAACDYKRALDGDQGPNTGGMGGYSPPPFWTAALEREVRERCMLPVVRALASAGTPYTGVLYGGLMLTDAGPQVLEFNARFGDPEAQLILPRLQTDLMDVLQAVVEGHVDRLRLSWSSQATVGVVVASGGYPASYEMGLPVRGLDAMPDGAVVFHAGTALGDGEVVTAGGRVVIVVGQGATLALARARAYAGAECVRFERAHYRRDIAALPEA